MNLRRHFWGLLATLFHKVRWMVFERPYLLLIVAFFASPVGPHVLYEYEYRTHPAFNQRIYSKCIYIGSRGVVNAPLAPDCPWVAFLDSRKWKD